MEAQRCLGNSTTVLLLAFLFFWQLYHGNSRQLVPQTPLLQYFLAPFFFLATNHTRVQCLTSYVSLHNHWNNLSIRVPSAPKLIWLNAVIFGHFPMHQLLQKSILLLMSFIALCILLILFSTAFHLNSSHQSSLDLSTQYPFFLNFPLVYSIIKTYLVSENSTSILFCDDLSATCH